MVHNDLETWCRRINVEKTIMIGDREIKLRATAAIPYLYRQEFGSDMLVEIANVEKGTEARNFSQGLHI